MKVSFVIEDLHAQKLLCHKHVNHTSSFSDHSKSNLFTGLSLMALELMCDWIVWDVIWNPKDPLHVFTSVRSNE